MGRQLIENAVLSIAFGKSLSRQVAQQEIENDIIKTPASILSDLRIDSISQLVKNVLDSLDQQGFVEKKKGWKLTEKGKERVREFRFRTFMARK